MKPTKALRVGLGRFETKKLKVTALLGFLLLTPFIFFTIMRSDAVGGSSIERLKVLIQRSEVEPFAVVEEKMSNQSTGVQNIQEELPISEGADDRQVADVHESNEPPQEENTGEPDLLIKEVSNSSLPKQATQAPKNNSGEVTTIPDVHPEVGENSSHQLDLQNVTESEKLKKPELETSSNISLPADVSKALGNSSEEDSKIHQFDSPPAQQEDPQNSTEFRKSPAQEKAPLSGDTSSQLSTPQDANKENIIQTGKLVCNYSDPRSDVCTIDGDVRIQGASIILASDNSDANSSWKIKPYARKWEAGVMSYVKNVSVQSAAAAVASGIEVQQCSVNHTVPALVFTTGGFQGNIYHDLSDVLVPLFLTTNLHKYYGEVQLLIVEYKPWWIERYQPVLAKLTNYDVINLDSDSRVHCFQHAIVGLKNHREMSIEPQMEPKGYTMSDFRRFLRASYSLKRDTVRKTKNPKLLLLSRKRTRMLINEQQVVELAQGMGFQVTIAGEDMTKNLATFASIVNSHDILMGIHGAGLSNMVFLPTKGTVIQIIPWGKLKWYCWVAYGEPPVRMGLRYIEYEIGQEESSLIDEYPRNHTVFTNPQAIHNQGFIPFFNTFLVKQSVRVDLGKFKGVLSKALRSHRR